MGGTSALPVVVRVGGVREVSETFPIVPRAEIGD